MIETPLPSNRNTVAEKLMNLNIFLDIMLKIHYTFQGSVTIYPLKFARYFSVALSQDLDCHAFLSLRNEFVPI